MKILIVPGAFTAAEAFVPLRDALRSTGRAVETVELPARRSRLPQLFGGGLGDVDDVLDDLADASHQSGEELLLVGHSLGGLACLRAARRWAADTSAEGARRTPRGLALLTPAPPGGLAREILQMLRHDPVSGLKFAALAITSKPLRRFDGAPPEGLFTDRVTDEELRASGDHRRDESWLVLLQLVVGSRAPVRELDIPTLVVGGTEDGLVPAATCEQLAEELGAEYAALPVGHAFVEEAAGQVVTDVLVDWIGSL